MKTSQETRVTHGNVRSRRPKARMAALPTREVAGRHEHEGLRLRFYQAGQFEDRPTTISTGPNGPLVVATAETTALDLADRGPRPS